MKLLKEWIGLTVLLTAIISLCALVVYCGFKIYSISHAGGIVFGVLMFLALTLVVTLAGEMDANVQDSDKKLVERN